MGGQGSGSHYQWWRGSKKTPVEDCRHLDANRWMRAGILKDGAWHTGRWVWYRDQAKQKEAASIGYEANLTATPPWVRLTYTFKENQTTVDYRVALTTSQVHRGGRRWWFVCPLVVAGRACNRRVGKIFLPPGARYYGCRRCYQLTYTSCQESHRFDGLARMLALINGWDLADVKEAMKRLGKR